MADKIVDINNYKERRGELLKAVAYDGPIVVPDIRRMPEGTMKEKTRQERYKSKKSNRQKLIKKQKRQAIKKLKNKVIAYGLIGIMAFGGFKAYNEYKDSKNTLTLEQALENGENLENLRINQEIANKIEELNTAINGDLTNEEIIKLAPEITNLQFEVAKTKVADTFNVDIDDVKLYSAAKGEDEKACICIEGKRYYEETLSNKVFGVKTVSSDMADYVDAIAKMQEIEKQVLTGNINRDNLIEIYKETIEETSKFAAGKMEKDKNGNLIIEKTRVSELEEAKAKEKEQKQVQKDEDYEIEH